MGRGVHIVRTALRALPPNAHQARKFRRSSTQNTYGSIEVSPRRHLPTRPAWSTHISANANLADAVSRARHRDICNLAKSVALRLAERPDLSNRHGKGDASRWSTPRRFPAPCSADNDRDGCVVRHFNRRSIYARENEDGAQAKLLTKRRRGGTSPSTSAACPRCSEKPPDPWQN